MPPAMGARLVTCRRLHRASGVRRGRDAEWRLLVAEIQHLVRAGFVPYGAKIATAHDSRLTCRTTMANIRSLAGMHGFVEDD